MPSSLIRELSMEMRVLCCCDNTSLFFLLHCRKQKELLRNARLHVQHQYHPVPHHAYSMKEFVLVAATQQKNVLIWKCSTLTFACACVPLLQQTALQLRPLETVAASAREMKFLSHAQTQRFLTRLCADVFQ